MDRDAVIKESDRILNYILKDELTAEEKNRVVSDSSRKLRPIC
jgi:hypothetical protein